MKKILSYMRKAIEDYNMIEEGDRIAVGISGGKDSLTLLKGLKALQGFYPKKFEIEAVTIDLNFGNSDFTYIQDMCDLLKINYTVKNTHIADIVFDIRKESNPCSLCAKMRRGALNNVALSLNCNKVALGHHKDDTIETLFLNMFFTGRIDCYSPVTYLDRKNIFLIRPMIYLSDRYIQSFSKRMSLPITSNLCPVNGNTKREYIKNLLNELDIDNKGLKDRLFGSVQHSKIDGWQ